MSELSISKEIQGTADQVSERVADAIKPIGFGILTRIEFDQKIKEKLGETIPRTIILGACNPKLAYEAYQQTTDVALLIPCNIVVREIGQNKVLIEAMRPTKMLEFLKGIKGSDSIFEAERNLQRAIEGL